ncbi:MAG: spiro-SPASM protein, partial [Spirochaetota bacterium]
SLLLYVDDTVADDTPLEGFSGDNIVPLDLSRRLSDAFPGCETFFSVPVAYSGSLLSRDNVIVREGSMNRDWNAILERSGADNIIRVYADAPFTDPAVIQEMLDIHVTYVAEYTYSENVPSGCGCDIMASFLIQSLPEDTPEKRALPIEKVIRDNINQFDVELYYTEPDIRHKRLSFRTADLRERRICQNLFAINNRIPAYREIGSLISSHPETVYVAPSYLELQLNRTRKTLPLYAHPGSSDNTGQMSTDTVGKILDGMREFGLPYSVSLTFGDPLLHEKFYSIMQSIRAETHVETIIIETEATYTDSNFVSFLREAADPRITVIVECNGYTAETYSLIHGTDRFETVLKNIIQLQEILENNLYIQIMKINETEPFLDMFYDFWEKHNVQIILQKQNTYLGKLPDRRYYDLTPLTRIPCWHLQRDLYILPDGRVSYCKQDVDAKFSSLDVQNMPISEIWEKRKPMFLKDYREDYPASPDCRFCDEWFTFNL